MNPARFDKKIILQHYTTTVDDLLQTIEDWSDYAQVWAQVIPVNAREFLEARQNQSENTYRFVIRYSKKIASLVENYDTRFRISYKNRIFEVISVINDNEQNVTYTIVAEHSK